MGKWSSQIDGVFDYPMLAYMDNTIAYPSDGNVNFYDTVEEKLVKSSLPEACWGISAGKEYFYVLIEKELFSADGYA